MRLVSGWRLALRLAWRDAWRAKGRSVLVLVMVTFPVVAVVAADVAQATSSVSSVEGLDRRLGSAQAKITALPDSAQVYQLADPDNGGFTTKVAHRAAASPARLQRVLGGSRSVVEVRGGQPRIRTDLGVLTADGLGVDLTSPLARGLVRLTSGRLPRTVHEVAVNAALAHETGLGVGDTLTESDGRQATVVGIAESTGERTFPFVVATTDFFPAPDGRDAVPSYLVGGAPVTWAQVKALNAVGAVVVSRQVVEHPPPADQLYPQFQGVPSDSSTIYAVLALVGVMALIEVVLLAGPALAVGARRQSRTLALMAANGGTPPQSRRVVLGTAVVIGAFASVAGVVLGIGLARLLLPVLQSMSDTYFGPFQIRWEHVLGIAAFGLLSALLAAVVPAWIASRQDVVAVLAGRRGDRAASRRSPIIGVVLLAAGVVVAVLGARQGSGELLIAGAAVLSVLGMIFLVPVVVVVVARLGRRLPLPLRYAVRDAARHRTRTVPAVAAVAATVAGVVALSIANTSDQAQARAEYHALLPHGMGAVYVNEPRPDWGAVEAAVHRLAPAEGVLAVPSVARVGQISVNPPLGVEPVGNGGGIAVVSGRDAAFDRLLGYSQDDATVRRIDGLLRRGRIVAFSSNASGTRAVTVRIGRARHRLDSTYVELGRSSQLLPDLVVPPTVAHRLGLEPAPASLLLTGPALTAGQESGLRQALTAISAASDLYVERGYQVPGAEKVVLWILFGLAAVLMLGGTLTATFLALSDARPDLATLSAVGAAPRTRRGVAAAYAISIGLMGAVLGAAVGLVPGIAVTYPLTRSFSGVGPSHYLTIPWLEILGLVVLLPLVTALIVGLVARSRLPMVARLD